MYPGFASISLIFLALVPAPADASVTDWFRNKLNQPAASSRLDPETVVAGLREALEKGTTRAVQELGRENGFWSHPTLRIPVPQHLQKADRTLRRLGQARIADDFAHSLNRAAERATPVAREIFIDAIRQMTIQDALAILHGPQDAATNYFRRHTEKRLVAVFHPVVASATTATGVTRTYKNVTSRANALGLTDDSTFDIDSYITHRALDAIFLMVAEEEGRIRRDPAARTSDLLRYVFRERRQ